MESFEMVVTAVSTVGFPIAMCGVLIHYGIEMFKSLEKEIDELRESINKSCLIMQKLIDKLGVDEDVEIK